MEMSKEEATTSLDDVLESQRKIHARRMYRGPDVIYVIWGVIWMIAFSVQQFIPGYGSGIVWTPLVVIGFILTVVIAKNRTSVKSEGDLAYGLLWPVMFGFIYLWMFMVSPMINVEALNTAEGQRNITAIFSTVPMCVYVIMGLMGAGAYMGWLGLGISVSTLVGLIFIPDYFYLWMAVTGGGALCVTGFFTNREWKTA